MDKKFLLTTEELNAVSKLITNSVIACKRATKEGYLTEEEIEDTLKRAELWSTALAKLLAQSTLK